jgi:hypothetical protein
VRKERREMVARCVGREGAMVAEMAAPVIYFWCLYLSESWKDIIIPSRNKNATGFRLIIKI